MKQLHRFSVALLMVGSACVGAEDAPAVGGAGEPDAVGRTVVQFDTGPLIVDYEVRDGRALIEGDIDIGAAEDIVEVAADVELKDLPAQAWTWITAAKWPGSTIYYEYPVLPITAFNAVNAAIDEIEAKTDLKFEMSFEGNRIRFVTWDEAGGSSSIGMQGGVQLIRLNPSANRPTVMHELLHAAGFWHEQSRTDRDDYVDINYPCIPTDKWSQFSTHVGFSTVDYDTRSIMHYSSTTLLADKPGCTWTIRRQSGSLIPFNSELSIRDIVSVDYWY